MCKKFIKNRHELKKIRKRKTRHISWVAAFNYMLVVLLVSAGVYYLNLVNQRAVSGYKIAKLEKKVNELKKINEKLDVKLAELQETAHIKEAAKAMQMAVVDEVEYITALTGELAQR